MKLEYPLRLPGAFSYHDESASVLLLGASLQEPLVVLLKKQA